MATLVLAATCVKVQFQAEDCCKPGRESPNENHRENKCQSEGCLASAWQPGCRTRARRIQFVEEIGYRSPSAPQLRVHGDRGEAGDGVDLVDLQRPVLALEEEVDPRHAGGAEARNARLASARASDGDVGAPASAGATSLASCLRGTCLRSRRTRRPARPRRGPTPWAGQRRAPPSRSRGPSCPARRARFPP